ncbi:MAG: hypothetical protein Q9213_003268 [Squamulea squamosa]
MGSLGDVDFSSPFFEQFPALPPPPGVQSNFDNPYTRGPDVKFIVVDLIYSPTILMAKLSLLSLYYDVFGPNRGLRYAIYFGTVVITLFYAGMFIAFCVLAIPRPGQSLISTILSKDVASLIPISVGQGGFNVASDFYIFLLPIPGVLQLQMPTKKKIGVCAIFATGSL